MCSVDRCRLGRGMKWCVSGVSSLNHPNDAGLVGLGTGRLRVVLVGKIGWQVLQFDGWYQCALGSVM